MKKSFLLPILCLLCLMLMMGCDKNGDAVEEIATPDAVSSNPSSVDAVELPLDTDKVPPYNPVENSPTESLLRETLLTFSIKDTAGNPVEGLFLVFSGEVVEENMIIRHAPGVGITDIHGETYLASNDAFVKQVKLTIGEQTDLLVYNRYDPLNACQHYPVTIPDDDVDHISLVWEKDTPSQSLEKIENQIVTKVVDETGEPMVGVRVAICCNKVEGEFENPESALSNEDYVNYLLSENSQMRGFTNDNGEYAITNMPKGNYTVIVSIMQISDNLTAESITELYKSYDFDYLGEGAEVFTLVWEDYEEYVRK